MFVCFFNCYHTAWCWKYKLYTLPGFMAPAITQHACKFRYKGKIQAWQKKIFFLNLIRDKIKKIVEILIYNIEEKCYIIYEVYIYTHEGFGLQSTRRCCPNQDCPKTLRYNMWSINLKQGDFNTNISLIDDWSISHSTPPHTP